MNAASCDSWAKPWAEASCWFIKWFICGDAWTVSLSLRWQSYDLSGRPTTSPFYYLLMLHLSLLTHAHTLTHSSHTGLLFTCNPLVVPLGFPFHRVTVFRRLSCTRLGVWACGANIEHKTWRIKDCEAHYICLFRNYIASYTGTWAILFLCVEGFGK